MNITLLIGNVGKEPDMRTTAGGKKIATLSLATTERFTDKNGEKQERTAWHTVVVLNEHLTNVVENYVRKGSKLAVVGRVSYRSFDGNDGQTRYVTEIVIGPFGGEIELLTPKTNGGGR